MHEAIVQSALLSAERAIELGLGADRIVLSAKVSAVQGLITVLCHARRALRVSRCIWLTEAGMGSKGIVASSAALGALLQQGIGAPPHLADARAERRPHARGEGRAGAAAGAWASAPSPLSPPARLRAHHVAAFQELARDIQDFIRDVDAGLEAPLSGGGDAHRRGDGLHRQRARQVETRRYRVALPAPARRRRRPCRRRQEGLDLARADAAGESNNWCWELLSSGGWPGRPRARRRGVGNARSLACGFGAGCRLLCGAGARRGRYRRGGGPVDRLLARVYDAVHPRRAPAQRQVAAIASIAAREGASGDARGTIAPSSPRSCATSPTPIPIPEAPAASHRRDAVLLHRWILSPASSRSSTRARI